LRTDTRKRSEFVRAKTMEKKSGDGLRDPSPL